MTTKSRTEQVFDALPTIEQVEASKDPSMGTPAWIAKQMPGTDRSIGRYLTSLHKQNRAHIHDFTAEMKARPIWVSGQGVNKEKEKTTAEAYAKSRRAINQRYVAKTRSLSASGEARACQNLTQANELARSLLTVKYALAAPRNWISHLVELQEPSEC